MSQVQARRTQELRNLARRIAEKRGLDPELFVRLIQTESNFNPNARGAAGEIGLGQMWPITSLLSEWKSKIRLETILVGITKMIF